MSLIQKTAGNENQELTFVAYSRGEEVKEIKVYFDGDDFSLFDRVNKRFLKDEHGYPFFGRDKTEDLINDYVSNQESITA